MNNLFVNCNNCGESLQINDEIAFVTCRDCHASLEIVRTFNSVYTEVKKVKQHKKVKKEVYQSKEIDTNEVYKQIELLDRTWQNQLPNFIDKGMLPVESNFVIIAIFCASISFLFFWISQAISMGAPFFFLIVGVFMLVAVCGMLFLFLNNKRKYKVSKTKYELKRKQLLESLNQKNRLNF